MTVQAAQQLPESSPVTHLFIWQRFPLHLNNRGTLPRGETHSERCDRQEFLFASHVCYIVSCVTSPPGQNLVVRDPPTSPVAAQSCSTNHTEQLVLGTAIRRRRKSSGVVSLSPSPRRLPLIVFVCASKRLRAGDVNEPLQWLCVSVTHLHKAPCVFSSLCFFRESRVLDCFRQTLKKNSFQNLEQVITSGTDETSFWTPLKLLWLLNVMVVGYHYSKLLLIYTWEPQINTSNQTVTGTAPLRKHAELFYTVGPRNSNIQTAVTWTAADVENSCLHYILESANRKHSTCTGLDLLIRVWPLTYKVCSLSTYST